jgi:predicted ATP-grasp superfamily ATP-dependent carboligase
MVEYKVNPDGRAVLMEVNGRYWGTIALPIFSGINFPLYHWQLVHGGTPAVPDRYAADIKWVWTPGHVLRLHGLLVEARRSAPARKELLQSLMQFPAAFGASDSHSLLSISDSMPAILDMLHIVRLLFLQDMKALFKRIVPRR